MKATNKKACQLIGWDRRTQSDDLANGDCRFVPAAEQGYRFWGLDDMAAALNYLDGRKAGLTVKVASVAASRLRDGMRLHPDADQLTAVTIENGSVSILPTTAVDLSTGFVSGGYLATATVIDVRNLRARVQRAIEADAAVIGDE